MAESKTGAGVALLAVAGVFILWRLLGSRGPAPSRERTTKATGLYNSTETTPPPPPPPPMGDNVRTESVPGGVRRFH